MRGHLYCSPRCARDDGRAIVWNRLRATLAQPVSSRLAVTAVAAALAAPTLLAVKTVAELDRLNEPPRFSLPRQPLVAKIDSVETNPGGVRIEGTAPEGTAVFLFSRGQFAGAAPTEKGRFRFDGVPPPGPYRVGALPLSAESRPPLPSAEPASEKDRETAKQAPVAADAPIDPRSIPDFNRGPADRREVLVSFDAGSSDRGAREILDALRARRIRTTIFLTGEFIRRYPELTRRIAADGHEVGNHTDSHPHLTTYADDGRQATRPAVDRLFLARELGATARAYRETTGRDLAPIWRAPFGEHNAEIRRWAAEIGYWHVGWTGGRAGLDGLDWISDPRSRGYASSDRLIERLLERAENGGIVLLHLGSDREDPVSRRVADLLDGLTRRGFRLVRATDLLERQGLTERQLALLRKRLAP